MDIIVSNMDSTPIYEQITRQIKAKILGGELQPGEALPSMRLLAKELRISARALSPARPDAAALLHRSAANVCGKRSFARWKTT